MQPDVINLTGDIFDLPEFGKYDVDPRSWNVVGRIKWVHEFLAELREACPNAQIDLVEGNHEHRLLRHFGDRTPALKVVLSELHALSLASLLGVDKFEVNYISKSDLGGFTQTNIRDEVKRNFVVYDEALLAHHFPDARSWGLPGWNGHDHKHHCWPVYTAVHGASEWHQLGCGHMRDASFANGEKWSNGFLTVHLDAKTKSSVFNYHDVRDHAVIHGKWYERLPAERV